ncbi:MarR family transcriptional regulator [Acinetobacter tandoii]|nr:MarR family transcriptional regulator [Acinetobacter tandoii]
MILTLISLRSNSIASVKPVAPAPTIRTCVIYIYHIYVLCIYNSYVFNQQAIIYMQNTHILWTDRLHRSLISIADLVNRLDVDTHLLDASNIKLDRALFPLLTRIQMSSGINVAELANIIGRDHSTVSRQVVKLEQIGLIIRMNDPRDQRSLCLYLSDSGIEMLEKVNNVRRTLMEDHFSDWNEAERDYLIALLERMLNSKTEIFIKKE